MTIETETLRQDLNDTLATLEGAANYIRGLRFDHRIPKDIKDDLQVKAAELDSFIEDIESEV